MQRCPHLATETLRTLLRSAFHGYITLEANGGFRHSRDVQKSWERALDGRHLLLENWPAHAAEEERT